ncbi:MAG: hypothetical protein V4635_16955 [Bacteroidota bacterium]
MKNDKTRVRRNTGRVTHFKIIKITGAVSKYGQVKKGYKIIAALARMNKNENILNF